VILLRLRQRGAKYTSDIAKAFLEMPDEEMDFLVNKSVASSSIAGDSKAQRQGVISSIAIFLNGISAVQKGTWTIKDFLNSPDDSRLFILGTEDTRAMFAPLFRLMLAVAFSAIESKQEIVHEDRYWFFLDEIHQLGDIRLDEKLATLRKFGVCIFSGVQSDQQFMAALGDQRGEVVMNCFNTVLMLRANDDKLQERAWRYWQLGYMCWLPETCWFAAGR
jgi:type IV secretory pathway TraG/TraD family ATPase VirD4